MCEKKTGLQRTILVGDSGVGKTSLLVQFDQGKFIPGSFSATVGIGFTNKVVTVDGVRVKLQIWDTAGQERFRSVTHAYYRDAQALLLLYDITNKSSFDNIRAWLTEIHEYAQRDVVIMLLGNKGTEIQSPAAGGRTQLPDPRLRGVPEEAAQLLLLLMNPQGLRGGSKGPRGYSLLPQTGLILRHRAIGERVGGPREQPLPNWGLYPAPAPVPVASLHPLGG
ncbi:ras-related protein Rab-37 isoform X2 [Pteronotus mesoamericanus]|uniref:ras-related protein Rab-37 isoform X2 n=1 Tax=Pteronotus mesoamericanus TaxID=1884717 RepID=UPI0023EB0D5F|nr:ras-related protein Rab-37 isoform X2 [Pteronotus parnellii mesoamericanus]